MKIIGALMGKRGPIDGSAGIKRVEHHIQVTPKLEEAEKMMSSEAGHKLTEEIHNLTTMKPSLFTDTTATSSSIMEKLESEMDNLLASISPIDQHHRVMDEVNHSITKSVMAVVIINTSNEMGAVGLSTCYKIIQKGVAKSSTKIITDTK